jgi:predicted HTH domain antitoxin
MKSAMEGAMNTVVIEISGELMDALRVPREEQVARLRQELAIRLYQKGILSFGKARELAQMTKWKFYLLLGDEGIVRRYDVEDLEEDLKTLESLS